VRIPRRALFAIALLAGTVVALSLLLLAALGMLARSHEPECPPEEILVKFQRPADPAVVSSRYGAAILSKIESIDVYLLAVPAGTGPASIAALQADPEVVFAEPNGMVGVPEQPPPAPEPCAVQAA
jgi:hypothetical protein